jgi:hypothetical protein
VLNVRDTVKLENHDLVEPRGFNDFPKVFQSPSRIGVAGRRDEQRVMPVRIKRWPDFHLSIRHLRLHAAPAQAITQLRKLRYGFRAKAIPGISKADRPGNPHSFQLSLNSR